MSYVDRGLGDPATQLAPYLRPGERLLWWGRLAQLGFRDTFRERNTSPVTKPGYTWTPGYPPPSMTADEVHDRIDVVYAAGPSTTTASRVVGEPLPSAPLPGDFGGPHADLRVGPWPSDHRAVASTFEVTPATPPDPGPAPVLTTSKTTYQRCDDRGVLRRCPWR